MSAPAWHDYSPVARVLCAGDDLGELIQMQWRLDVELDFVIVASADEVDAALTAEPAFDVIILDQYTERIGGLPFLQRLRQHSPDAERLIVARQVDERVSEMLQSDCRVMRVLQGPFSAELLCRAVEDALLRHRARALRAMTVPRVTPMDSGHGCVV